MTDDTFHDYRYRFPVAGLALALQALDQLRAAGLLGTGELPDNMLGDPIHDGNGAVIARGRTGWAGTSFTNSDTGASFDIPAAGDPAFIYIHIRSVIAPDQLAGLDPTAYGLEVVAADTSASVLGVWA